MGRRPTVRTAVDFEVPRGACDCHVHVFDPSQFPYASERVYTPPQASVDDLRDLQTALRFDRVVIVQPSVYGTDNSCTLDAMRKLGARARGVAVIDKSTSAGALDAMAAAGVRGVRLNFETAGESNPDAIRRGLAVVTEQLRSRDWHVQFNTSLPVIAALHGDFAALPFPVVLDHFARAKAALGPGQPGFDALISLVKSGRAYVKISAAYRTSRRRRTSRRDGARAGAGRRQPRPHRLGQQLAASGRGATRTDIAPPYPNDDGLLLNQLPKWVPDAATRKKILVDNPARLYGFEGA
jgi:predicted TIM-barrel fold metal-dependent hydrolase